MLWNNFDNFKYMFHETDSLDFHDTSLSLISARNIVNGCTACYRPDIANIKTTEPKNAETTLEVDSNEH